jgi:hypothetical protein
LRYLSLRDNVVGKKGSNKLADALPTSVLEELSLEGNPVTGRRIHQLQD